MKDNLFVNRISRILAGVLLLGILCVPAHAANAQRIALLPLGDITFGTNGIDGVNLTVTQDLQETLKERGFDLVSESDIEQFMVYNRVRFVGYLNAFLARKIGIELECSHVLVGTVTEYQDGSEASLGMTLTMFDTTSGMPVWGGSRGMSAEEIIGALGLGEPKGVRDLQDRLFADLLTEITANLDAPSMIASTAPYQIVDLQLSSRFSRGGESLNCQLEVNFIGDPPERIALKSGSREYPLTLGATNGIYHGTLFSEKNNGTYDVSLVIDWGEGMEPEIISGLASYQVYNAAPKLELKLNHEVEFADITMFRNDLVIVPILEGQHRMERWLVEISNEDGKKLMIEEHLGELPERLVWGGTDAKGRKFQDGLYTFSLKAWDVVGNEVGKTFPVYLQTEAAPLDLQVFYDDGKKFLEIRPVAGVSAPVVSWQLMAINSRGKKFLQRSGFDLPVIVELPDKVGEDTILCDLQTKDSLGNRLQLRRARVDVSLANAKIANPAFASATEAAWVDNF